MSGCCRLVVFFPFSFRCLSVLFPSVFPFVLSPVSYFRLKQLYLLPSIRCRPVIAIPLVFLLFLRLLRLLRLLFLPFLPPRTDLRRLPLAAMKPSRLLCRLEGRVGLLWRLLQRFLRKSRRLLLRLLLPRPPLVPVPVPVAAEDPPLWSNTSPSTI